MGSIYVTKRTYNFINDNQGQDEGLSAIDSVIRGDYMHGRGSSNDVYSAFSCILAVKSIQEAGGKHPRVFLVLETQEES